MVGKFHLFVCCAAPYWFTVIKMTITYTTSKQTKWTHDYNTMQNRYNHASMNKEYIKKGREIIELNTIFRK